MENLQYPIGKYRLEADISPARLQELIAQVANAPADLRKAVGGLSDTQLDTPYRPGGWTLRQVVHHLPDSHMNAYVRFKLALTEDEPTIKPYEEARWAEQPEARSAPVEVSLSLLDALHARWVLALNGMAAEDFSRRFLHPESGNRHRLDHVVAMYAWHGRHHIAHVTSLREQMGW
jgi:hypothetical protein